MTKARPFAATKHHTRMHTQLSETLIEKPAKPSIRLIYFTLLATGLLGPAAAIAQASDAIRFSTLGTSQVQGVAGSRDDAHIYTWNTEFSKTVDAAVTGLPGAADINALDFESENSFLVSFNNSVTVPGIGSVVDKDIIRYNDGVWSVYEQGSTLGLTTSAHDIDAISLFNNMLYFSITATQRLGNLGVVDDADIVRWNGTTLEKVWDATDNGLANSADIDGLQIISDTHFLFSLLASNNPVPIVGTAADEDIVAFEDGQWTVYFDGSTQGLTSGGHDIDGLSVTTGDNTPEEDTEAPTWAGGAVQIDSITDTTVSLNWPEAVDNVAVIGYRVVFSDNGTQIVVDSDTTTTNVSGLTASTSYSVEITAEDTSGNVTPDALTTTITTDDSSEPPVTTPPPNFSFSIVGTTALPGSSTSSDDADLFSLNNSQFSIEWDATIESIPAGADVDAASILPDGTLILSFVADTNIPGLGTVRDEDLIAYDGIAWGMFLDASSIGLTRSGHDIDAVSVYDDIIYFSTVASTTIPGLSAPDDGDIYTWDGSVFNRVFDASQNNLPGAADIDALVVLANDHYLLSFNANNTAVSGFQTVQDEDLLEYDNGVWSLYFDGTPQGLTSGAHDLDAITTGTLYTVTPAENQPPITAPDTAEVADGGTVTISVLSNDSDLDGTINPLSLDIAQISIEQNLPAFGTINLLDDGRISYSHYGGPNPPDTFYYVVSDNDNARSEATLVAVSVEGNNTPNNPPTADGDSINMFVGETKPIDVLANDNDADGQLNRASLAIDSNPSHGDATVLNNQTISYKHTGSTAITDSFTYSIADNLGATSIATVTVTVTESSGSDEPPSAGNDTLQISGGVSDISIFSNDNDPENSLDPNSVNIETAPANALSFSVQPDGFVQYVPSNSAVTTDSFSYTVRDIAGNLSNVASVTINLQSTNEPVAISAFHRSGQTFLTWPETNDTDGYHVYRHNSQITAANLAQATKLTARWGALDSNTSRNIHGNDAVPANFVINDLSPPLSDDTGLFVYTTQPEDSSTAFYAITTVAQNGNELISTLASTDSPVNEAVSTPRDVLTLSVNNGKGRIYTQYMDYSSWNPTYNGYGFNYALALPSNYDPDVSYPLMVELHAYNGSLRFLTETEYDYSVITLLPDDPGPNPAMPHTWWYGHSADYDYRTAGVPTNGVVENFTQQRVMRAIDNTIATFDVDTKKIHAWGHSMGGSGALSLGIHYGTVFSGIYASQPMTNYTTDGQFQGEMIPLWGALSDNLPIVNAGPHSNHLQQYGIGGSSATGVWDWMNHHKQLSERRGEQIAFLMTFHGKLDGIIEWQTQGKPFANALNIGSVGYAAENLAAIDHTWVGFVPVDIEQFGFGYVDDFPWKYPLDLSFPSIQNASGSSPLPSVDNGDDKYNRNIQWSTPHFAFAQGIVDETNTYGISIRSTDTPQTADITPRRTQLFKPQPTDTCNWNTTNSNTGNTIQSGTATVDADALITIPAVEIVPVLGTRLTINCP